MDKLKRAVIKEEFIALTGDFKQAIILNQFIYWSERVKDVDKFIQEENKRINNNDIDDKPLELQHGWIYKKAEELSNETMMNISKQTVGRLIEKLIDNKWIEKRRNPKYKWDKTYQYRVNLIKICKDLYSLGYTLQDYKFNLAEFQNGTTSTKMELYGSEMEQQYHKLLTEITPEITSYKNLSKKDLRTLSFEEFIKQVSVDEYNQDKVDTITYFLNEQLSITGKVNKIFTYDTWYKIYDNWLVADTDVAGSRDIDNIDDMYNMIDDFFNTDFKREDCNYSIILFDRTKGIRYLKCAESI